MQNTQRRLAGAETILLTCGGLKRGERILIVHDSHDDQRVQKFASMSEELGALVTLDEIEGHVTREPPPRTALNMLDSGITLFCVNEQRIVLWGHSDAKAAAVKKGARVLFLTQELDQTPQPSELQQIRERSQKMGDILETVSEIKLVTGTASQLEVKLAKRKSLRLSSILSAPGSWGAVPDYAESAIAPLESGSNGTLRVDGMIIGIGKVDAPVDLEFKNGRLVKISGGKAASEFEKLLSHYDDSARVLCEVGFGTNHLRRDVKGEFDDKKALGSVHIALGDNHTFGGENKSNFHVDCLIVEPKVYFDGKLFDLKSL